MIKYNEFTTGFNLDSDELANGFKMTFENGWTISVQWSSFNYCANREFHNLTTQKRECVNAECAVWDTNGDWFKLTGADDVQGWMSPDEVAELITRVQAFSPVLDGEEVDEVMASWG